MHTYIHTYIHIFIYIYTHTQSTTALHAAASNGQLQCVITLAQNGANINARDDTSTSSTPLLRALERGHEEIAMYLIRSGADVMKSDKENTLPLHMAAAACSAKMFDKLVCIMGERKRDPKVCMYTYIVIWDGAVWF